MDIKEVIKRIEKGFPMFDISFVGRRFVADAKDSKKERVAWSILIAEPRNNNKEQ